MKGDKGVGKVYPGVGLTDVLHNIDNTETNVTIVYGPHKGRWDYD